MRAMLILSALVAVMLLAAPPAASAQAPPQSSQKPYCLESSGGVRNCIYESLERCQQMVGVRTVGGRCVSNPELVGTTGRGGLDAPRGARQHSLDRLPAPVR